MDIGAPVRTARLLLASFAVGFLTLGASGQTSHRSGHHPPKKMEREQVEALEQQWSQAMLAGDVTAMDKLLSDDYLGVTPAGDLLTKAQQLERMQNRQITMVKLDTAESKIKLLGHIAIVTSLARIDALTDGRPTTGEFRYTKVYQRLSNGTWSITSFEATRIRPGEKPRQRASVDPGQS